MDLLVVSSTVAFITYLIATLAIISRLFHPKGPNLILVLSFGCIGLIAHSISNSQFILMNGNVNFSLPNVISLVSLLITLSVSAVALRYKVNLLLPVVYGFAGIWQVVMLFIPHVNEITLVAEQFILVSHISMALIAYCVLIIGTLFSFQVAYINFKLKSKNLAAVTHFPPLMQVENQLFFILALGTICLLVSQITGFIFLENFLSKENAHKTVLSLISLLIYLTILWGHYKQGWRGHKVLVLTIIASILLTLAYFGSRFVKEFLL